MPIVKTEKVLLAPGIDPIVVDVNFIPPYIDTGILSLCLNKTTQTTPPLGFSKVPGTSIGALFANLLTAPPLGAQVQGYATLSYDLTKYKPAQSITLIEVQAVCQQISALPSAEGMVLNIWDQNGVPGGCGASAWLFGNGAVFHANVVPQSTGVNVTFDFFPNLPITGLSGLTLQPGMNIGAGAGTIAQAWIGPTILTIQYIPLINIQAFITTDGGFLLSGVSASVSVFDPTGKLVAGPTTTTTGSIIFQNLAADIYTVSVTVGSRTVTQTQAMTANTTLTFPFLHPVASLVVSPDPTIPNAIFTVDPSTSHDPTGKLTLETLDFGDGTAITGLTPANPLFLKAVTHSYPSVANFTITLTVTNDAGLSSTVQVVQEVQPAIIVFAETELSERLSSVPISLLSSGTVIVSGFTDGGQFAFTVIPPGTYTVSGTLSRLGAPGITKTQTITLGSVQQVVTLIWHYPRVSFTGPPVLDVGQPGIWNGTTTTSGEPSDPALFNVTWTFGDASPPITGPGTPNYLLVSHFYGATGTYNVILGAVNDAGLRAFAVMPVTVFPVLRATLAASLAITSGPETFTATASGGDPPYTAFWNFGDGTPLTGGGLSISHTYKPTVVTNYTCTCTVLDAATNALTLTITITAYPPLMLISLTADTTALLSGGTVTFTANIGTTGLPPVSATWNFGDGSPLVIDGLIVSHTFTNFTGTQTVYYTVTVTVTDAAGETVSGSIVVSVSIRGGGPGRKIT